MILFQRDFKSRSQIRKKSCRGYRIFDSLFGGWKAGEITEAEYRRMRELCKTEMLQTDEAAEEIKEEPGCLREKSRANVNFKKLKS